MNVVGVDGEEHTNDAAMLVGNADFRRRMRPVAHSGSGGYDVLKDDSNLG